jgi:hypothetical protein
MDDAIFYAFYLSRVARLFLLSLFFFFFCVVVVARGEMRART